MAGAAFGAVGKLSKTNIAPSKVGVGRRVSFWGRPIFRAYVGFTRQANSI